MMKTDCLLLFMVTVVLATCGDTVASSEMGASEPSGAASDLIILDNDLQRLKDDFNNNRGRVRLLFLNGPTCGICLRGMADLNDEFVAASQNDDRLITFVVHLLPAKWAQVNHQEQHQTSLFLTMICNGSRTTSITTVEG